MDNNHTGGINDKSVTKSAMKAYSKHEWRRSRGFLKSCLSVLSPSKQKRTKMKNAFAREVEESFTMRVYSGLANVLLCSKLRTYGVFLFFFGFFAVVSYLIDRFLLLNSPDIASCVWGVGLLISSLFLLPYSERCSDVLRKGKLTGFILHEVFGLPREKLVRSNIVEGKNTVAFILGAACGVASAFYGANRVFGIISLFVAFLVICYKPETGVIALLILFPFLPGGILSELIIVSFLFYVFKALRGKRVFKIEISTLWMLFFGLFIISAGLTSADKITSFPEMQKLLSYIVFYFLTVSMFKSIFLVKRCFVALSITAFISGVCALVVTVFNYYGISFSAFSMLFEINSDMQYVSETYIQFLVILFPLLFATLKTTKKKAAKLVTLLNMVIIGAALVYSASEAIWFSLIIAVMIYVSVNHRKMISVFIFAWVIYALLLLVLPAEISSTMPFIKLAFVTSRFIAGAKESIYVLLEDVGLFGIGLGSGGYERIYSEYAVISESAAPTLYYQIWISLGFFGLLTFIIAAFSHIQKSFSYIGKYKREKDSAYSVALLSGLFACLIYGLFDNFFDVENTFFIFFAVCAILSASVSASENELAVQDTDWGMI